MINWIVSDKNRSFEHWAFPSFEIQEYLLPIINVGVTKFDEYGRTEYLAEDCRRLTNVVNFALETMSLMESSDFHYQTISEGTVLLNKADVESTLMALLEANEIAITSESSLVFLGD